MTGYANYKDQTLEILPSTAGKHVQYTVDAKRVPKGDDGMFTSSSGAGDALTTTTSTYGTGATTLATGSAVVQDLLVVYTAASASTWGQATIESMIQSAVQSANQAYVNSGVNVTLNLVGLQQTTMTESGSGMQTTLNNLRANSSVKSLRDSLGADMVVLVSQDSDWCGYADLRFTTYNGVTTTDAYAVNYSTCLSNNTLAHEVGHLQQLDHNRENANGTLAAYPYSYGYRQCVTGGFMDIMSYSCTGASRILQFSTPNRTYNGYATGVAYETNPSNAADAARSLNDTAVKVANYKASVRQPGRADGAGGTERPRLARHGLQLGRARLGRQLVERVRLQGRAFGGRRELHRDREPRRRRGQLHRRHGEREARRTTTACVRSTASVARRYSNTLARHDAGRAAAAAGRADAPASVAAANKANGTALVSWADASSNETSFEVRRETWNAKRGVWGSMITAATVPLTSPASSTRPATAPTATRCVP